MRHVFATACLCLLTCSSSIAAEQKLFSERFDGTEAATNTVPADGISVRAKTSAISLDPQPLGQKPADLKTGMPSFAVLADQPITIPQQDGTGDDLLRPRELPAPPIKPKPVVHRSTEEVCDTLAQAAQNNKLPAPFFIRLLFQESGFKPGVVSHAGAQGIAQFMPETAASVGLDNPFDPLQAIPAAARLLRNLVDKFGNVGLAAAAYNAGPKRIQDWLSRKGKLPNETQGYVKVITGRPAESWKGSKDAAIATKLPERAPCRDTVTLIASNEQEPAPVKTPARHTRKHVAVAQKEARRQPIAVAHKETPNLKRSVTLAARKHTGRSRIASR